MKIPQNPLCAVRSPINRTNREGRSTDSFPKLSMSDKVYEKEEEEGEEEVEEKKVKKKKRER